ncbi:hypothetical protein [Streptomyces sp. WG5]|uniref:hypothetical protein n=1 Tax=Streptomyces sp. WG5 TaxID=3417648 RepID=UPI003CF40EB5
MSELNEDAGYWGFIGNEENITAAVDGAKALEDGAFSVKVGHTIYSVVGEESDEGHTER